MLMINLIIFNADDQRNNFRNVICCGKHKEECGNGGQYNIMLYNVIIYHFINYHYCNHYCYLFIITIIVIKQVNMRKDAPENTRVSHYHHCRHIYIIIVIIMMIVKIIVMR